MRARQCLWRTILFLLVGSVSPLLPRLGAAPFTYQGRLLDGAFPANGSYELRFRLFDSLAGGSAVGGELVLNPVVVTNGLFAVSLDFGTGIFTGADRFLEMAAKVSGDPGAVSTISPRQTITAVPYALFAFSGSGDASALTTGTLSDARLSGNIARTLDVLGVSNVFQGRLTATNTAIQGQLDALTARLDQLTTALTAVSNQVASGIPQGTVLASVDASDASLVGQGFNRFAKLEATGWKNGTAAGAPGARTGHSAVWTGTRMLVWGGTVSGQPASTGGSYDPVADNWSSTSPIDPPTARTGHIAVWTGSRMLIWGGFAGGYLGDGSSYDPTGLSWAPLGSSGAPTARDGHGGIWTGSRLVLWGGRNTGGLLSDGAVFDPVGNAWTALPTSGAPAARQLATMTWAADRLIVFGGEGVGGELDTGAMLPFTSGITPGAWQSLATLNAPGARVGHTAVWTGTRLLIWGGKRAGVPLADGASLDPVSNTWTPLPTLDAPGARFGHEAVWTGTEMVLFGGENASGPLATGAAFNPSTGRWRALADGGSPLARTQGTGIWTGSELLVFGGINSYTPSTPIASLQRLNPQPTWYLFRKP